MLKFSLIFFTIFTFSLIANTPKIYAALGDVIYNNVASIEKLAYIDEYARYKDKILQYAKDVNQTKIDGFKIEQGDKTVDRKKYLTSLRSLSRDNDFFVRESKLNFKESIEQNNNSLFIGLVNSGLIDTKKNKDVILTYYFDHKNDINATGVIQKYLDEDEELRRQHERKCRLRKTKAMLEKEKIARIRSKDKSEQEQLEKKLDEELISKKIEIREKQKEELSY